MNVEIFNFGFSGNGKMETTVGEFLAPVNASVIVVDCSWNMNSAMITENAQPLVRYFRAHGRPDTPLVLAEGLIFGRNWAVSDQKALQDASNAALRGAYDALVAAGDANLHYVTSEALWGNNVQLEMDSPTANGLHPTDAGMRLMAAVWTKTL